MGGILRERFATLDDLKKWDLKYKTSAIAKSKLQVLQVFFLFLMFFVFLHLFVFLHFNVQNFGILAQKIDQVLAILVHDPLLRP